MIDFHTHILHGIDDGSDSIDVSVRMLEKAYRRGTDVVVLTPHCFPKSEMDIIQFIEYRNEFFHELTKACIGHKVPEMKLAAEVNVCFPFADLKGIEKLCIEGTNYMLVEMPNCPWSDWMFETIYKLTLNGIRPIIAHVDRYINFPKSQIETLTDLNPVFQVNAEFFQTKYGRRFMLELFKRGIQ